MEYADYAPFTQALSEDDLHIVATMRTYHEKKTAEIKKRNDAVKRVNAALDMLVIVSPETRDVIVPISETAVPHTPTDQEFLAAFKRACDSKSLYDPAPVPEPAGVEVGHTEFVAWDPVWENSWGKALEKNRKPNIRDVIAVGPVGPVGIRGATWDPREIKSTP